MNYLKFAFLIALSSAFLSCKTKLKENSIKKTLVVNEVLISNSNKINTALNDLKVYNRFPRNIENEEGKWEVVNVRNWCSGFWPGVLWYAYEASGKEELKLAAEKFTAPIKTIAYTPATDHDIGFQVYCSYGNGYRLTGNSEYKKIMLAAADTLATLYNPIVGSIHSWPSKRQYPHNTIIDNMMNLELLFWAAKNGGSKKLYEIAESHAEVTMNNLIRPDYSTYHLGSFDDKTGKFIRGVAHQGYADDSMWARGQAWGIYGFSFTYRETSRKEFLETCIKLADKFLERLPEDVIPFGILTTPKYQTLLKMHQRLLLPLVVC